MRRRRAIFCAACIFSGVPGHQAPADCVLSLAMMTTDRPATTPNTHNTPRAFDAFALPSYERIAPMCQSLGASSSYLSTTLSMRSSAVIRPCDATRFNALSVLSSTASRSFSCNANSRSAISLLFSSLTSKRLN